MNYRLLIFSLIVIFVISCKPQLPEDQQNLVDLESAINANPTKENVNKYLTALTTFIADHKSEEDKVKDFLEKGVNTSLEHGQSSRAAGFLQALIRNYFDSENTDAHIWSLAEIMEKLRKPHVANILYNGLSKHFPTFEKSEEAKNKFAAGFSNVDTFMTKSFNQVFEDPDKFGVNQRAALRFVDVAEAYALVNPKNESTPGKLYQASEIARSIRTFQKALNLYDWILDKYPNYEKGGTVMFLKGFVLENELEQLELAKSVYEDFLQKYPDHDLASSVKFLLENLGKPDEEILEFIEQQKKDKTGGSDS
jgi:TolA-binding protein